MRTSSETWTAEQEVEAVKQQLPFGAWREGRSLARCVEDLRMERDLYRGTLVGLLPVCDAAPSPIADRIKRFINQALRGLEMPQQKGDGTSHVVPPTLSNG